MGSVVKSVFGGGDGGASKAAARAQQAGTEAGIAEQRRQFDITQQQFRPFREAGVRALGQQEQILGLQGPEQQAAAFQEFRESPGQAFLRERGERSLLRNQAAIGGLGGGNIRSALQQQGIGFAEQQFGEFQNHSRIVQSLHLLYGVDGHHRERLKTLFFRMELGRDGYS